MLPLNQKGHNCQHEKRPRKRHKKRALTYVDYTKSITKRFLSYKIIRYNFI